MKLINNLHFSERSAADCLRNFHSVRNRVRDIADLRIYQSTESLVIRVLVINKKIKSVSLQVKLFLIKTWRIYQIFLISFLAITWIYDIANYVGGSDILIYVILDAVFLSLLNAFFGFICQVQA